MFVICTNPSERLAGSQLTLTSTGELVGICRATEAVVFDSRADADAALARVPERIVAFHFLIVHGTRPGRQVRSGNGWMVGHPGYDLA